jgi:OOP family OmpA-OmpF porin
MHVIGKSASGLALASMLLAAAPLMGCGPTVFAGKVGIKIVGNAPAPPPPPPPQPAPPPPPPKRVKIVDNKIVINEKVQFEVNKANILEESHSLLNEVAGVMKKNPHVKKVQVEGHASSEGNPGHNKWLSGARAKAVMTFLVGAGVEQGRLQHKGFGSDKPIADNETEEGRVKNRRVEFNILEQDVTKKEVPAG